MSDWLFITNTCFPFVIGTCFPILGLFLNFFGAIEIARSFTAIDNGEKHTANNGKSRNFVLVGYDRGRFRFGVGILAFGFVLQLIAAIFT